MQKCTVYVKHVICVLATLTLQLLALHPVKIEVHAHPTVIVSVKQVGLVTDAKLNCGK